MNETWEWFPPHAFWDTVLRLAPAHIFVFDSALICRYAAPVGEAFLGEPRDALTGRHAAEILPPAANGLGAVLQRAALEGVPWSAPQYRYSRRVADGESVYAWAVQVLPLRHDGYQGVLLSLADVLDLVEQRERLQLECDDLRLQVEQQRQLQGERLRALAALAIHLRTQLTPIWGYLQLLAERPGLWTDAGAGALLRDRVLPLLQSVIDAVGNLEDLTGDASTPPDAAP